MAKDRNLLPSWIKNTRLVSGQDHLSLEAISINLYGKLLPGLTNLTQRVRYYSIYPWILSNYVKLDGINNRTHWRNFLRRSEFLYALVAVSNKNEFNIPGSRKAKEVLDSSKNKIDFIKYAEYDSKDSYWKYSFGAYGQYFLGSLRHLGIIFTEDADNIDYFGENGKELVKIMDLQISKEITNLFFDCVKRGYVTVDQLKILYEILGPSKIQPDSEEAKKLRQILLEQTLEEIDGNRIDTFKVILNIISNYPEQEDFDLDDFKYTVLYGNYYNGKKFEAEAYRKSISLWRAFMISEATHYAMEVLFRVMLEKVYDNDGIDIQQLLQLLIDEFFELKKYSKQFSPTTIQKNTFINFTKLISGTFCTKSGKWFEDPNSIYSIVNSISETIREEKFDKAFFYSFVLLSKLIHDYHQDKDLVNLFSTDGILVNQFSDYNAFKILNDKFLWDNVSLEKGIEYIFRKLIINRHALVALDKLRIEGINTFKFELRENQIYHIDDVYPTFTNPRLLVAMNFLNDLGLYSNDNFKITPLGKAYL